MMNGGHNAVIPYAGWRCRECDYDLTGVGEPRCPECGVRFDVEVMQRIADGRPAPSTPWDTDWRFFATMWQVFARPKYFARRLATNPLAGKSLFYALGAYILAAILVFVGLLIRGGIWFAADTLNYSLHALQESLRLFFVGASAIVLEECIAASLNVVMPFQRPRNTWQTWRSLMHYHAGFAAIWIVSIQFGLAVQFISGLIMAVFWIVSITRMARALDSEAKRWRWVLVPIALMAISTTLIGFSIYLFVRAIASPGGV
ncbi:MAG: hypothetical protein AB7N71_14335 [Phycisphaerae bacterium]